MMISVVVLSKNNGETLDGCLRSIVNANGNKEIIVVDAHSTDETPRILGKYEDQIRVVYDKGKGIGIARNLGVEVSSGKIICFVDADAFVSRDHFKGIERYLEKDPEVGVLDVQGTLKLSKKPTYIEKLGYRCQSGIRKRQSGDYGYAGGYFISFRRKAFYDADGFWSFPPFSADDLDFTVKVVSKAWKKGQIRTKGWHQFRRTMLGLLRERWGFGKGRSCFDKKYLNDPVAGRLLSKRMVYRILGKYYWLGKELIRLFAPVIALKYLREWKSLRVYSYYIVSEWIHILGYMWGWLTWARRMVDDVKE